MAGVLFLRDGLLGPIEPVDPPVDATVAVDIGTTYQTMRGWEVSDQAGDESGSYSLWKDDVMALAVTWGVDRVRLHIKHSWENPDDTYDWTTLTNKVANVVGPLKAAVEAAGRTFYINACYQAFGTQPGHGVLHENTTKYADYILAVWQHLETTYGWTPDALEIILEPDNGTFFLPYTLGNYIVAAGSLLATNGYHPDIIAASNVNMGNASTWFDQFIAVSGVTTYLTDFSYHRYVNVSDANLSAIASRAATYGLRTAMLEHIGSGVEDLYKDLTLGNNSSWQQYTLAYPTSDNGAQLFRIVSNAPVIGSRTYGLGQYFKYVRHGAVRVSAVSADSNVRPVAFKNPDNKKVVVLHCDAAGDYTVSGLTVGATYSATRATATADASDLSNVVADGSGVVSVSVPSASILTLAEL